MSSPVSSSGSTATRGRSPSRLRRAWTSSRRRSACRVADFCSLEGKTALVTGGSRGIGRAIALELARAGARVTLSYRSGKDEADEDWSEVIGTNLGGVFHTCRAAARGMMKRRSGSIVNISSIVGVHGNPGQTNNSESKAGIIGFTKALARELGVRGVRANVVAPGYIDTRLTQVIADDMKELMLASTPLGRFGQPEDIAGAVRFLCSGEASFITGEVLLVDGGLGM